MFYQHLDDFRSAVIKIGISNRELYFWLICSISGVLRGLSCKNGKTHYFGVRRRNAIYFCDLKVDFMIIYMGKHDHALIDLAIFHFTAVFRRTLS